VLISYLLTVLSISSLVLFAPSVASVGRFTVPVVCTSGALLRHRLQHSMDIHLLGLIVNTTLPAGLHTYREFVGMGVSSVLSADEYSCWRFQVISLEEPVAYIFSPTHWRGLRTSELVPYKQCTKACNGTLVRSALQKGPVGDGRPLLSKLDFLVAIASSVWICAVAYLVFKARVFAPEPEYLAWGAVVQRGLALIVILQFAVGAGYAASFVSDLDTPVPPNSYFHTSVGRTTTYLVLIISSVVLDMFAHALTMGGVTFVLIGGHIVLSNCRFMLISIFQLTKSFLICMFHVVLGLTCKSMLHCRSELAQHASRSYESSSGSNGEDDLCAICLDALCPDSSPASGVCTALQRLRPRFRVAASQTPRRTRLVRLHQCGHAFHADCFLDFSSAMPPQLRCQCPTCGIKSERRVWLRRQGMNEFLRDLFKVVRKEVQKPAFRHAVLMIVGYIAERLLNEVLHARGISKKLVLDTLFDAPLMYKILGPVLEMLPPTRWRRLVCFAIVVSSSATLSCTFRDRPWPAWLGSRIAFFYIVYFAW